MDVMDRLSEIIEISKNKDLNEADTRHRIIDTIIHDCLSWPKNRVSVEEYISPGYADYILKKSTGEPLLFIEAKKSGIYFDLPLPQNSSISSEYISIEKLVTNAEIKKAANQVRGYCLNTGCEFACITNGTEWIFFKIFEKDVRWEKLNAFVIRKLSFFKDEYTLANKAFSFSAITENSSLLELLSSSNPKDRSIFHPKEKITSYDYSINANRLAVNLRSIASKYFGVISDNDACFMDKCYVTERDYHETSTGMRRLIKDSLSPYFERFGVQQLNDTDHGDVLSGSLAESIKQRGDGDVLVLFGGKGAGKSTFVNRVLHHNIPNWLNAHGVIAIVDLLKIPEDKNLIRQELWSGLCARLDIDGILKQDRNFLIEKLFSDKYEIAQRQDLAGLSESSEAFNVTLNGLVSKWKEDFVYCAERLVEYHALSFKGVIVVVDNTDQYSSETQDYCFAAAQEISKKLKCTTLISMREERFYGSKIHGILDAYQNAGFHISSPKPSVVFQKRLSYVTNILNDRKSRATEKLGGLSDKFVNESIIYLNILNEEFSKSRSPLNDFLTACSHGDTRLSLDVFRSFLLSGYTNVDEMIDSGSWHFQMHQVIKPVMIPNRYFYDEKSSHIPNIYQIRSLRKGSHFTALRILRKISKDVDPTAPKYFQVTDLCAYFMEKFGMLEDFKLNLDTLLRHGFVESDNRLDKYSERVDSVKITSYGKYMLDDLSNYFSYVDLVCTDCGVFSQTVCNHMSTASNLEFNMFRTGDRVSKIKARIDRAESFVNYLANEEASEKERYALGMPNDQMFTNKLLINFNLEKVRALESARRQISK